MLEQRGHCSVLTIWLCARDHRCFGKGRDRGVDTKPPKKEVPVQINETTPKAIRSEAIRLQRQ